MKKIFLLAILCLSIAISHAQSTYPIVQAQGSSKTLIINKGGIQVDSSLILPVFIDTALANISPYIKNYAGSIMRVGNNVYVRSYDATKWILLSSGGSSNDSLAWHTNLNIGAESVKLGTNNNFFLGMYTNNALRMKIRGDGISRSANNRNKYLTIDTLNKELYYTDGSINNGTVTSISQGYGIVNTPNPITTTGTIKVDTATLSNVYLRKTDTANKYVNTITRVPGKDSIIYYIGSTRYAIKDSIGNGNQNLQSVLDNGSIADIYSMTLNNLGNNITLQPSSANIIIYDSTTNNQLYLLGNAVANVSNTNYYQSLLFSPLAQNSYLYTPIQTNSSDTLATLADIRAGGGGSGTVTSVATGYGLSGGTITTSGTLVADTSVSGLSGKYVRISDTATMLIPYMKKSDSSIYYTKYRSDTSRTNIYAGINSKLNISDTASMLNPYLRLTNYGLSKSGQTVSADTSKLSTLYQTNLRVKYTDTATMLSPYINLGGYGLTKSGQSLKVDTATLSAKYVRSIDTANKWVNTITRTPGKDSIIYFIDGNRYAIKDSVGTNPPASGYYLSISDSTTQDNPTANTPRAVKFNVTDLANGFSLNTQTAIFVGTINNGGVGAGTTLNVTSLTSGKIKIGMVLTGGSITTGTFISAFISGSGGIGTYEVSISQLRTSTTYTGTMTSQIVCANTGIYNLQFSSQMDKTDGGVDYVNFWLRKNGTDITASAGVISLQGNSPAYMMAAWNYVIQLVDGDTIELYWASADINMSIKAETSQTSPFVHPAIQSTIFTITQQSGILAGTGITALNGLTESVQTFAVDSTNTTFKITSSGTTHTFNIPNASATGVTRGLLSNTEYTTFNSKIGPSDTATMLSPYLRLTNYGLSKSGQTVSADTSKLSTLYQTNLRVKYTDTASMLSPYLRKVDTASLSNRINLKVNISDTASMLSPYLRKVDTASLSNRINLKLNISDTASMLSPYLKKSDSSTYYTKYRSDTSRTNIYNSISTKLNITDTSVFQRKSLPSYTFIANNTTATANGTTQTFRDSAQKAYTGSIVWTGTTAPSGTTNHSYRWSQVGKLVTLRITLIYSVAGTALTAVTCALPSDLPAPEAPTGSTANSSYLYEGSGTLSTGVITPGMSATINGGISELKINSGGTGYEIQIYRFAAAYITARATIQYYAQ
jgi:hypothetical protein